MVNITGNTFEANGANLDFSRKIELGCQSDVNSFVKNELSLYRN